MFKKRVYVDSKLQEEIYMLVKELEENGLEIIKNEILYKKRYTKEWYEFLKKLGNSIIILNKIHNKIINEHPYFKIDNEEIKKEREVAIFYMNLILSKIKSFFFTETPQESKKDLRPKYLQDIIGYVFSIFDNPYVKDFDFLLYAFYYKIFLMFDFIYCKEKQGGVFPVFRINKEKYEESEKFFVKLKNNFKSPDDFRKWTDKIIKKILIKQIEGLKHYNDSDEEDDFIYCSYVEMVSTAILESSDRSDRVEAVAIEPISYYFAFKLWKIKNLIECKIEETKEIKDKNKNDLGNRLKRYIESQIKLSKEFYVKYKKNRFEKNFKKVYKNFLKADKEFINYFNNTFNKKSGGKIKKNITVKQKEVLNAINKMLGKDNKEMWKFNRLLTENIDKKEILSVVYALGQLFKNIGKDICEYNIVGMYKSGALLAHLINIMFGAEKRVFLFTSYPFIKIHPLTYGIDEEKSFLIVDENYKTGFTYLLAREYINGLIYENKKNNDEFNILSIANFTNFEKINNVEGLKTIAEIDYKRYSQNTDNYLKFNEELFKENSGNFNIKAVKIDEYLNKSLIKDEDKIKNKIEECVKIGEEYFDYTRVLSDTKLLFSIANYFKREIIKELRLKKNKKDSIALHSPDDEGRLLSEAIALLFRIDNDYKDLEIIFNEKDDKNIFVDLSIDSGLVLKEYKGEKKRKDIKEFDLGLFIGIRKKDVKDTKDVKDIKEMIKKQIGLHTF